MKIVFSEVDDGDVLLRAENKNEETWIKDLAMCGVIQVVMAGKLDGMLAVKVSPMPARPAETPVAKRIVEALRDVLIHAGKIGTGNKLDTNALLVAAKDYCDQTEISEASDGPGIGVDGETYGEDPCVWRVPQIEGEYVIYAVDLGSSGLLSVRRNGVPIFQAVNPTDGIDIQIDESVVYRFLSMDGGIKKLRKIRGHMPDKYRVPKDVSVLYVPITCEVRLFSYPASPRLTLLPRADTQDQVIACRSGSSLVVLVNGREQAVAGDADVEIHVEIDMGVVLAFARAGDVVSCHQVNCQSTLAKVTFRPNRYGIVVNGYRFRGTAFVNSAPATPTPTERMLAAAVERALLGGQVTLVMRDHDAVHAAQKQLHALISARGAAFKSETVGMTIEVGASAGGRQGSIEVLTVRNSDVDLLNCSVHKTDTMSTFFDPVVLLEIRKAIDVQLARSQD